MAEILGLGITHHPAFARPEPFLGGVMRRVLQDPGLPERYRTPDGWPEAMRREWGADSGQRAALLHRDAVMSHFRQARRILDEFHPDFVLVWGDDQYENFKEDIIPPFCIMAYEALEVRPWSQGSFRGQPNAWNELEDTVFSLAGHAQAGRFLATRLLEQGFDVAYAYRPLHHDLGHAFLNTVLFLDYDRRGWDFPLVPFQINSYGRRVIANRGFMRSLADAPRDSELDPPSPMPWRCFDLGRATARALSDSPWRVACIASSSWSHANLNEKAFHLHPDIEADREMYRALEAADYDYWRNRSLGDIEAAGQHEILNWCCLIGAMAELDRRPTQLDFVESWLFNSSKCFASFCP